MDNLSLPDRSVLSYITDTVESLMFHHTELPIEIIRYTMKILGHEECQQIRRELQLEWIQSRDLEFLYESEHDIDSDYPGNESDFELENY
jgi:hypothetical protein